MTETKKKPIMLKIEGGLPESFDKVLFQVRDYGLVKIEEHLPQSLQKVLLEIAKEGPETKYQVEKATKVNHASVHENVKKLLSWGAVEGEEIGITRTGQPKISYKLTFWGFCLAIRTADIGDIDKIVKKWRHLEPLMLGKWEYFKEKIGVKEAEDFLVRGARTRFGLKLKSIGPEEFRVGAVRELFVWHKKALACGDRDFQVDYEKEYGRSPKQSFERWLEAFKDDPELNDYALKYVEGRLKLAHGIMEWAKFLQNKLKKQNSPGR